jgi:N-formylglutamate amidohydrolase
LLIAAAPRIRNPQFEIPTPQSALVLVQRGDLPILLTAPHGGSQRIPGVPARTSGIIAQDARTLELVEMLLAELETLLHGKPYAVAALFHRRFVDANRPAAGAFEHPDAAPYYRVYHAAILDSVQRIRVSHQGGALLVDIHGQAEHPELIHRGTRDGLTVRRLIARHGAAALAGDASIFGQLEEAGYRVFPPNLPFGQPREDRRFNGGYTVATYGSERLNGIDAIQIEIGSSYRQPEALPRLATALARALATFYRAHLASRGVPLPGMRDGG